MALRIPGFLATLLGSATPNNIDNEQYKLQWTGAAVPGAQQNALTTGRGAVVMTGNIPTRGATQLAIGVDNTIGATQPVILVLRWLGNENSIGGAFDDAGVLAAGAPAAGIQRWNVNLNDYVIATGAKPWYPLPSCAHFFQLGVYVDAAAALAHVVTLEIERLSAAGVQAQL